MSGFVCWVYSGSIFCMVVVELLSVGLLALGGEVGLFTTQT